MNNTKPVSDSGHTRVTVIRYKDYKAQVTGDGSGEMCRNKAGINNKAEEQHQFTN